jgi:hypothetical protein
MRKWSVLRLSMRKPSRTDLMMEKLCPEPALALPQKAKAADRLSSSSTSGTLIGWSAATLRKMLPGVPILMGL